VPEDIALAVSAPVTKQKQRNTFFIKTQTQNVA